MPYKVGHHNVSIKSLAKSVDPDTPTLWYAQDAAGAIWRIDIVASHTVSRNVAVVQFSCIDYMCTVHVNNIIFSVAAQSPQEVDELPQWRDHWSGLLSSGSASCLHCSRR